MKAMDLAAARRKAFRLLSLRPHSEYELKAKLRNSGFSDAVIKEALENLRDLQYLNDASFARQWARNLAVNKFWGNRKIIASLREKGLAAEQIDDAVASARRERAEEEAIAALIQKKAAIKESINLNINDKRKIFQSLVGRGFPPDLILNQLGKIAEERFNGENG